VPTPEREGIAFDRRVAQSADAVCAGRRVPDMHTQTDERRSLNEDFEDLRAPRTRSDVNRLWWGGCNGC